QCPICVEDKAEHLGTEGGQVECECQRCGRFWYVGSVHSRLQKMDSDERPMLAGWVWEQNTLASVPVIDGGTLDRILSNRRLEFMDRAKRLLLHLADQSDRLGKPLEVSDIKLQPMLQTFNQGDIDFISTFLVRQGWLEEPPGSAKRRLTGNGFIKA